MARLMYKWLLLPIWLMSMGFSANIRDNKPGSPSYPALSPALRGTGGTGILSRMAPRMARDRLVRPTTPHCAGQAYHRLPTTDYSPLTIPYSLSPIPYSIHPYFVSVSELEWNQAEKQVELSCKVYTDDFEEALKNAGGEKADLVKGDAARNKARMEAYIRAHFKVKVNGKPLTLQCIGVENDHEATWCYLQAPAPDAPASMEIVNTLFYEVKKEQVNIVHLRSGNARKSFRLVNPDMSILWKAED